MGTRLEEAVEIMRPGSMCLESISISSSLIESQQHIFVSNDREPGLSYNY